MNLTALHKVAAYIDDERHVYTGPRHRRKQEALKDLEEIQSEHDRLRAENEELREALGWLADNFEAIQCYDRQGRLSDRVHWGTAADTGVVVNALRTARASESDQ